MRFFEKLTQLARVNRRLRSELLRMQAEDVAMRRQLIDAGELYGPNAPKYQYHPKMAEVHQRNNARLREIITQHGWPGRSLVGEDGAEAAWAVAQHAILDTELQQRCLELLDAAVKSGEAPARHWAMLTDRVRMEKGEPQIYGSIFVGDENGKLVPWPIADPENVDVRRRAVGLPSMEEHARRLEERVAIEERLQHWAKAIPEVLEGTKHEDA